MSKFVDYYQLLSVPFDATGREVRLAYLGHAKQQHPDVGGSHESMQQLNKAYETLANAAKRAAYNKIYRLESHIITAAYETHGENNPKNDESGLDMSDDEIDDFINSVFTEYAMKPPEPSLHKKATKVVKDYLRNKKPDKDQT